MTDVSTPESHSTSPWFALINTAKAVQPIEPALIRAAFDEHEVQRRLRLTRLMSEALELRDAWCVDALSICPLTVPTLEQKLQDTLEHRAESTPKPATPRLPLHRRISLFLRRFKR